MYLGNIIGLVCQAKRPLMNAVVVADVVFIFILLQFKPMSIESSFRFMYPSASIDKVQVNLTSCVKID